MDLKLIIGLVAGLAVGAGLCFLTIYVMFRVAQA